MKVENRIKRLDNLLFEFSKQLSYSHITPINILKERKRFMEDKHYNPQFVYPKHRINYDACFRVLRNLSFGTTPLDQLYKDKFDEIYNFLMMFKNRGNKYFTNYSVKVFGQPTPELLSYARQLSNLTHNKIFSSPNVLSTSEAIRSFRKVLDRLNFDWRVVEGDIVSNALVMPTHKKFVIKRGTRFSHRQITRLIAHEIYTHILRAECGHMQPYKLFRVGLAGYESTEEGLALYKEKVAGVLDNRTLKGYAGRVLAIAVAQRHSFRKTYDFLTKFYPKDQAWYLTVRVKRGLEDTSQPGAFTKDLIYLKGYKDVCGFVKNRSCLHLLHYGKIGVNDALKIPLVQGLKDPDKLRINKFKNRIPKYGDMFW